MRIFCMTVGAGGEEKDLENLANALSHSIAHYKPDKIVFFGSENSINMIQKIKESSEKQNKPIINDEFVKIPSSSIDNFTECYNEICKVISKYPDDEIIMDYTSGTKTMVSAQSVAALLHGKMLSLTSGKRDPKGKVIPKTTKVAPQPLYEPLDKIHFENVKRDFNAYRFDSALVSMGQIVICEKKDGLLHLINGYKKWDLMEWNEASLLFKDIEMPSSISEKGVENKKFLNTLTTLYNKMDPKNKEANPNTNTPRNKTMPYIMILSDLLNNAERRIDEGKYDDAVSRLYRATELISQIMLLDNGIDEINGRIRFSDLSPLIKNPSDLEKYRSRIEKQDSQDLRKDMGARAKFQLLSDMGEPRGWNHYLKIRTDMENRNNSIMAHGLKPVGKDAADHFYASVLDFAQNIFTKKTMENFMQQSQFPKL